jgi:flagellar basal body-associated protein FliL
MARLHRRAVLGVAIAMAAGAALASEGGEKKKGGGQSYIQLPALTSSITRANGGRGVLTVEVGLDIPDGKLRDRAAASTPRLRDAYVSILQTYASTLAPAAPPNPDYIAQALQRSTDKVLARPGAKLLLGSVMVN